MHRHYSVRCVNAPSPVAPPFMSLIDTAVQLAAPWQSLYDDSTFLSTTVIAVHLTALLVGGGLAVAADRATLRATRRPAEDRARQLTELSAVHRPVLVALAVLFVSGLALTAADLGTFLASPVYWIKFGFVALLLANGAWMRTNEQGLRRSAGAGESLDAPPALARWRQMRWSSWASIALWVTTLVLGTALVNAA